MWPRGSTILSPRLRSPSASGVSCGVSSAFCARSSATICSPSGSTAPAARGEADPEETHHDRRSDIDSMAILGASRDVSAFKWEFTPKLIELIEAEGDTPPYYSLRMYDADRLRDRRRIRSFFFQEVDRDKIVLAGSALDSAEFR